MSDAPLRPKGFRRILLAAPVLVAGLAAWSIDRLIDQRQRDEAREELHQMERQALGSEPPSPENFYPIRVVDRPPVVSSFRVAQSDQAQLADDELVLGVELNGDSRAYPLNMMTGPDREVVNDQLAGKSIAATW